MTRRYRFVGSGTCSIGNMDYDRFGSIGQFTAQLAHDVLAGGGCFIPEQDFNKIGFTEHDLNTYGEAGCYPEPPDYFQLQRARAQARARELMANPDIITEYHADTIKEDVSA